MNKDLRNHMLAKTERNRIRQAAIRKYRRINPNWENGMIDRPHMHARRVST